jgi:hypothetical protein
VELRVIKERTPSAPRTRSDVDFLGGLGELGVPGKTVDSLKRSGCCDY